ncbi:MAG: HlyC/CorC family transporter [Kiritimatiellaeota bacterium]|nr:HlyC/CorC family transporter [Kiritimatiellota bacterium]
MSLLALIFLFILLLAGSAFFSGAETALFSLSRARLLSWRNEKRKRRWLAAELMENGYNRTLIVLILGNMFMNAALTITDDEIISGLGLPGVAQALLSIFTTTVFLLVLGEMTPKTIALMFPEKISESISAIVSFARTVLHPLVWILERMFSLILDVLGRKESEPLRHEEYSSYLDMAQSVGAFSGEETELISNALLMRDRKVAFVMTSRVDIPVVRKYDSAENVVEIIRGSSELFYPVIKEDIDDCGMLLAARDFFMLAVDERREWLEKATIPAVFLPENASLTQAIREMRELQSPSALVTDEYGGVTGMVRAKRIHEELVGDLSSEFEDDEPEITASGAASWLASGTLPLEELSEETGVDVDVSASNTLNGLFSELSGRIPEKGDTVEFEGLTLAVLETRNNRIVKMEITRGD